MPEKEAKKSNTGLIAGIIGGVVAVIAIVVVIIVIIANGSTNLTGKYTIVSMKEGETEITVDTLKKFGMDDAWIEFKSDGTGTMKVNGEETEFKYDAGKKTITADGDTREIKVDGNKVTIEPTDDTSMTFEKK